MLSTFLLLRDPLLQCHPPPPAGGVSTAAVSVIPPQPPLQPRRAGPSREAHNPSELMHPTLQHLTASQQPRNHTPP